jgi:hypothetical protein
MRIILILILTTIMISGCNPQQTASNKIEPTEQYKEQYKTFTSDDFSISYPKEWEPINQNDFTYNPHSKFFAGLYNEGSTFSINVNIDPKWFPSWTWIDFANKDTENQQKYGYNFDVNHYKVIELKEHNYKSYSAGIATGKFMITPNEDLTTTDYIEANYYVQTDSKFFTVSVTMSKENYYKFGSKLTEEILLPRYSECPMTDLCCKCQYCQVRTLIGWYDHVDIV